MKDYYLKFTQLLKYAPNMVVYSKAWMSKFELGISENMFKEYMTTMLVKDMDIS